MQGKVKCKVLDTRRGVVLSVRYQESSLLVNRGPDRSGSCLILTRQPPDQTSIVPAVKLVEVDFKDHYLPDC